MVDVEFMVSAYVLLNSCFSRAIAHLLPAVFVDTHFLVSTLRWHLTEMKTAFKAPRKQPKNFHQPF